MVQPIDIKNWILLGLSGATVEIDGDGQHFHAIVISPDFVGKTPLQRQRMVYATLGEKMGKEIHALSMSTLTPDQAAKGAK